MVNNVQQPEEPRRQRDRASTQARSRDSGQADVGSNGADNEAKGVECNGKAVAVSRNGDGKGVAPSRTSCWPSDDMEAAAGLLQVCRDLRPVRLRPGDYSFV